MLDIVDRFHKILGPSSVQSESLLVFWAFTAQDVAQIVRSVARSGNQCICTSSLKQRLPPAPQALLRFHLLWVGFPARESQWVPICRCHTSYAYCFEDHSDLQAAAWADSNLLPVAKISDGDLELVATGTWVSIERGSSVVGHIFDFDLIVERHLLFPETSAR